MLIILVALMAVVVAILAIPIDIAFTVQRQDKIQGRVTIGWLFGLVQIPVQPKGGVARPAAPKKDKRTRKQHGPHTWAMLYSKGFLNRLIRLLRRLRDCIHISHLRLHVLLGLADPADTGQLWGLIGLLALTFPAPAGTDLAIQPEFTGATFKIDGEGVVRIVPIEIMATLIVFTLSPVTLRALFALGTGR